MITIIDNSISTKSCILSVFIIKWSSFVTQNMILLSFDSRLLFHLTPPIWFASIQRVFEAFFRVSPNCPKNKRGEKIGHLDLECRTRVQWVSDMCPKSASVQQVSHIGTWSPTMCLWYIHKFEGTKIINHILRFKLRIERL